MHPRSELSKPSPKRRMSCAGLDDLDELLRGNDSAPTHYHRKRHHSLNNDNNAAAASIAASQLRHGHPPPPSSYPGALHRPDLPPFSGKSSATGNFYLGRPSSPSYGHRHNQVHPNQSKEGNYHRSVRANEQDNNCQEEEEEETINDSAIVGEDDGDISLSSLTSQQPQHEMGHRVTFGKHLDRSTFLRQSYRSASECSPREEFLVHAFGPTGFTLYGSPHAKKSDLNESCSGGNNSDDNNKHDINQDMGGSDTDAELKEDICGSVQHQQQYQSVAKLPEVSVLPHQPFASTTHGHFEFGRGSSNQEDIHRTPMFGSVISGIQDQKPIEYAVQDQPHSASGYLSPAQGSHGKSSGGIQTSTKWLRDEDERLRIAVARFGGKNWKMIAESLGNGRTDVQCLHRWNKVLKPGLIKGPWTPEEDRILTNLITRYGVGKIRWCDLALHLPGRIGKQCRERWCNHLDSRIRKGQWTPEEDDVVFTWQQKLGNKWSEIAKMLPGRTENAVKNRFNSAARRKWLMNQDTRPSTPQAAASPAKNQSPSSPQMQPESQVQQTLKPAQVDHARAIYSVGDSLCNFGGSDKVASLPNSSLTSAANFIASMEKQHQAKVTPLLAHESFPLRGAHILDDSSRPMFRPVFAKANHLLHGQKHIESREAEVMAPPVFIPPPLNSLLSPPVPSNATGNNLDFHLVGGPSKAEFTLASHLTPLLPLAMGSRAENIDARSLGRPDLQLKAENTGQTDFGLQSTPGNTVPDASVPMDDENMNSFLDSVTLELDDIME